MIQYLDTPDGVIGCRVSECISSEELEGVSVLVQQSLNRRSKINLYVEVESPPIDQPAVWSNRVPNVFSMLSNMEFDRVAIVSDDLWVRWRTEVEDALNPRLYYELFSTAERERALAWVQGEVDEPHAALA